MKQPLPLKSCARCVDVAKWTSTCGLCTQEDAMKLLSHRERIVPDYVIPTWCPLPDASQSLMLGDTSRIEIHKQPMP